MGKSLDFEPYADGDFCEPNAKIANQYFVSRIGSLWFPVRNILELRYSVKLPETKTVAEGASGRPPQVCSRPQEEQTHLEDAGDSSQRARRRLDDQC
jgi:hypothetical protein